VRFPLARSRVVERPFLAQVSRVALDGATDTLPALYAMPRTDFHDVTAGAKDAGPARPGYDLATGLGTPIADRVIAALLKVSAVLR
jgi:hypothetical protein